MAKTILTTIIVLVILAAVVILLNNVQLVEPNPSPSPTVSATPTTAPITGNIRVFSPIANEEVGLPLVIKGEARTFERAFSYRILDSRGNIVLEKHTMSSGQIDPPEFDPFEVSTNYPDPKTATGFVEVFEYSAKDGSEINNVTVPVKFITVSSRTVRLFFGNRVKDPQILNCDVTYAASRRIAQTTTPMRASLDELLMGTTRGEGQEGFFSNIPTGAKLKSVSVSGTTAKVVFESGTLPHVGLCADQMTESQITNTAKQFGGVTKVEIYQGAELWEPQP